MRLLVLILILTTVILLYVSTVIITAVYGYERPTPRAPTYAKPKIEWVANCQLWERIRYDC